MILIYECTHCTSVAPPPTVGSGRWWHSSVIISGCQGWAPPSNGDINSQAAVTQCYICNVDTLRVQSPYWNWYLNLTKVLHLDNAAQCGFTVDNQGVTLIILFNLIRIFFRFLKFSFYSVQLSLRLWAFILLKINNEQVIKHDLLTPVLSHCGLWSVLITKTSDHQHGLSHCE